MKYVAIKYIHNETYKPFQNDKKSIGNIKQITLNLTSYTNDLPENFEALLLMYMEAQNIGRITLDFRNEIAEYLERTPKQMWVSLWLNGELTTSQFKKQMRSNVDETSENLESFLKNLENWFNKTRFSCG